MDTAGESKGGELNRWTIGAIAVIAYCLANILHEAVGHGGACLLVGATPKALNAIYFEWDGKSVPQLSRRIIAAGGGFINLLTGILALAALRSGRTRATSARYFLWLFSAVSLLMAFGYLLFSGVLGIGDWIAVFGGLAPRPVVRVGLAAVGAILYFWVAPKWILPPFREFLAPSRAPEPQIRRLIRFPYVVGGTTFLVAGLLNPHGLKFVLISAAAAAFGGTSLLAWCKIPPLEASSAKPGGIGLVLKAQAGWISGGILMLIVFIGVLGPGIAF